MTERLKRIWRWLTAHVRPLPPEPDPSRPKQADPHGGFVGFRFWF